MIRYEDVVPGAIIEINFDPEREISRTAYGLQFKILPRTHIHQDRNGYIHVSETQIVASPNDWGRNNVNHRIGKCDKLIFSPIRASNHSAIPFLKTSYDFQ